jgi:hypothetical protein
MLLGLAAARGDTSATSEASTTEEPSAMASETVQADAPGGQPGVDAIRYRASRLSIGPMTESHWRWAAANSLAVDDRDAWDVYMGRSPISARVFATATRDAEGLRRLEAEERRARRRALLVGTGSGLLALASLAPLLSIEDPDDLPGGLSTAEASRLRVAAEGKNEARHCTAGLLLGLGAMGLVMTPALGRATRERLRFTPNHYTREQALDRIDTYNAQLAAELGLVPVAGSPAP